ncbi:ComF family protein [bacterium]|nr:MAG: ComF family protein [bacterium]
MAGHKWLENILDLIFPVVCAGCGAEGGYLCVPCQQKIEPPAPRCWVCSKNSVFGKNHPACCGKNIALDGLMVTADYHVRFIQDLIANLKYNSVSAIAKSFGLLMADYLVRNDLLDFFSSSLVTSIPLHKRRQNSRGFNQAELIAQNFAGNLRLSYTPTLERRLNNPRQVDLERHERLENVRDLFRIRASLSLAGKKIILVDDVATTGATLNECAKVLKQNQAAEVWGLVVARN